jgi:hypothetical protein
VHNAALRSIEDFQRGPTPQSVSYRLINSPTVTHIREDSLASLLRRGAKSVAVPSSWTCWLDRPQQSSNLHSEAFPAPLPTASILGHCGQQSVPGIYLSSHTELGPVKPHSSVHCSTSCGSLSETHSRASRAPLITLPYYQDYLAGHSDCRTRLRSRATRPLPFYPSRSPSPRALCVARFNTRSFPIIEPTQP